MGRGAAVLSGQRHPLDGPPTPTPAASPASDPTALCRWFQPGASGGKSPTFVQYAHRNNPGWNTDWNNVAPNLGVAWRPNVQGGWLRPILGDPEQATLRAGYSVAYNREGMGIYTGQYGSNPGSQVSVTRNSANGNLIAAGESVPVCFSQRDRLGPPAFGSLPAVTCDANGQHCEPAYPIALRSSRQDSINIFAPDFQVALRALLQPRASSGRSRATPRSTSARSARAASISGPRRSTTRSTFIENGFLNEFKLAQANLQANLAAGRGSTFAYFGASTGTCRCRSISAYFNGSRDVDNPAGIQRRELDELDVRRAPARTGARARPTRRRISTATPGGARTRCRRACPPISSSSIRTRTASACIDSNAYSGYDALQIEVRRRLSRGFQINGSYQYALETGSAFLGRHYGRVSNPTANVRHAIKTQWDWSVPVGRGRRFGTDMDRWLDAIVGGWEFNGAGRIQARVLNFGNVRLVGMTADELTRRMYNFRLTRIRSTPGCQTRDDAARRHRS